ncbi:hypothetical protein VOLCADRAFT_93700 [Volvox carteri f. nagariensis]|uniref:Uncharacterized protein n=1 Tax=Volvox carteri f. nagariensis TaxID=3068 RepID=D8U2U0_VOLCA|nr:uncharacterized protein VOLCADRAFT_93700 [Volvox carteri f. nagariensis]EFJ45863.1 hypothetical protein VOLCADRAFT_93700 [Volvox carteri f. nagariensis]|eukprot:XP_002952941.1 hypothetical protein VOLCADRAFT_93700 [Volvox carteri f. nagariensis]
MTRSPPPWPAASEPSTTSLSVTHLPTSDLSGTQSAAATCGRVTPAAAAAGAPPGTTTTVTTANTSPLAATASGITARHGLRPPSATETPLAQTRRVLRVANLAALHMDSFESDVSSEILLETGRLRAAPAARGSGLTAAAATARAAAPPTPAAAAAAPAAQQPLSSVLPLVTTPGDDSDEFYAPPSSFVGPPVQVQVHATEGTVQARRAPGWVIPGPVATWRPDSASTGRRELRTLQQEDLPPSSQQQQQQQQQFQQQHHHQQELPQRPSPGTTGGWVAVTDVAALAAAQEVKDSVDGGEAGATDGATAPLGPHEHFSGHGHGNSGSGAIPVGDGFSNPGCSAGDVGGGGAADGGGDGEIGVTADGVEPLGRAAAVNDGGFGGGGVSVPSSTAPSIAISDQNAAGTATGGGGGNDDLCGGGGGSNNIPASDSGAGKNNNNDDSNKTIRVPDNRYHPALGRHASARTFSGPRNPAAPFQGRGPGVHPSSDPGEAPRGCPWRVPRSTWPSAFRSHTDLGRLAWLQPPSAGSGGGRGGGSSGRGGGGGGGGRGLTLQMKDFSRVMDSEAQQGAVPQPSLQEPVYRPAWRPPPPLQLPSPSEAPLQGPDAEWHAAAAAGGDVREDGGPYREGEGPVDPRPLQLGTATRPLSHGFHGAAAGADVLRDVGMSAGSGKGPGQTGGKGSSLPPSHSHPDAQRRPWTAAPEPSGSLGINLAVESSDRPSAPAIPVPTHPQSSPSAFPQLTPYSSHVPFPPFPPLAAAVPGISPGGKGGMVDSAALTELWEFLHGGHSRGGGPVAAPAAGSGSCSSVADEASYEDVWPPNAWTRTRIRQEPVPTARGFSQQPSPSPDTTPPPPTTTTPHYPSFLTSKTSGLPRPRPCPRSPHSNFAPYVQSLYLLCPVVIAALVVVVMVMVMVAATISPIIHQLILGTAIITTRTTTNNVNINNIVRIIISITTITTTTIAAMRGGQDPQLLLQLPPLLPPPDLPEVLLLEAVVVVVEVVVVVVLLDRVMLRQRCCAGGAELGRIVCRRRTTEARRLARARTSLWLGAGQQRRQGQGQERNTGAEAAAPSQVAPPQVQVNVNLDASSLSDVFSQCLQAAVPAVCAAAAAAAVLGQGALQASLAGRPVLPEGGGGDPVAALAVNTARELLPARATTTKGAPHPDGKRLELGPSLGLGLTPGLAAACNAATQTDSPPCNVEAQTKLLQPASADTVAAMSTTNATTSAGNARSHQEPPLHPWRGFPVAAASMMPSDDGVCGGPAPPLGIVPPLFNSASPAYSELLRRTAMATPAVPTAAAASTDAALAASMNLKKNMAQGQPWTSGGGSWWSPRDAPSLSVSSSPERVGTSASGEVGKGTAVSDCHMGPAAALAASPLRVSASLSSLLTPAISQAATTMPPSVGAVTARAEGLQHHGVLTAAATSTVTASAVVDRGPVFHSQAAASLFEECRREIHKRAAEGQAGLMVPCTTAVTSVSGVRSPHVRHAGGQAGHRFIAGGGGGGSKPTPAEPMSYTVGSPDVKRRRLTLAGENGGGPVAYGATAGTAPQLGCGPFARPSSCVGVADAMCLNPILLRYAPPSIASLEQQNGVAAGARGSMQSQLLAGRPDVPVWQQPQVVGFPTPMANTAPHLLGLSEFADRMMFDVDGLRLGGAFTTFKVVGLGAATHAEGDGEVPGALFEGSWETEAEKLRHMEYSQNGTDAALAAEEAATDARGGMELVASPQMHNQQSEMLLRFLDSLDQRPI